MSKTISQSDLAAHSSVDSGLYIVIDGGVYDLTGFVEEHPGGAKILKRVGGKDASKQFWKVGLGCALSCEGGRIWELGRAEWGLGVWLKNGGSEMRWRADLRIGDGTTGGSCRMGAQSRC